MYSPVFPMTRIGFQTRAPRVKGEWATTSDWPDTKNLKLWSCAHVFSVVKSGCLLPMEGHAICERKNNNARIILKIWRQFKRQCKTSLALKTAGLPFLQEIVSKDLRTQLCAASAHIIRDSASQVDSKNNGRSIQVQMSFHKLLLPSEDKNKFLGAPYLYLSKRRQDRFRFRESPGIPCDNFHSKTNMYHCSVFSTRTHKLLDEYETV